MQQQVMLLRSRFKSTKDMWIYLSERRKYHASFLLSGAAVTKASLSRYYLKLVPLIKPLARTRFLADLESEPFFF